jgi:hypothetical protein
MRRGTRSVRLAARTLAFQAGDGGSIPPRTIGPRTDVRGQSSVADDRPVAQWRSGPLTPDRLGVRVPPGRLTVADGVQVLAAARPALTRGVRVRVPRASLVGGDAPVVDRRARWHAKPERRVRLPPGALVEFGRGDPVERDGPLPPLWCIGAHATLSRWKDEFDSRQGRFWHGTPTGRATKLKPWRVWVRLPPVLLAHGCW